MSGAEGPVAAETAADAAESAVNVAAEAATPDSAQPRARKSRRATRPAPAGSDPAPYDPPTESRAETENDARLRADRPPHWG